MATQLILRRSRTAAPAQAPTRQELVTRTARPRIAENSGTKAMRENEARERINERLARIAEIHRQIDALTEEQEELDARIEDDLRAHNLTSHSDGVFETGIEQKFSRQQTTINPKAFRNAVKDKDFWDSIEVGVGKAKEVLSAKEFAAVATTVPGKSLGHVFYRKAAAKKK